ncbi:alpha/beta fold hydrolase [Mucilaginibacter gynuensis]|uniref:Alpha/beta fold hydrolase n=1 Tax=Mucilaginibacter gynuensis TaxID=1302236 RepID=A0ABP8HNF6_9SPHI
MIIRYIKLAAIAVIISFTACKQKVNKPADIKYGDNPAAGKYADIRGFKMYYEVYGSGEPVLFIHGNGGSISNFSNQIPVFAEKYKVIAADSRAQGKSADLKDSLSYEMMADDLNALMDTLHIKQAYVVGWSDGGIDGLLLAMRHPDKVKKLAITGPNLWTDSTALAPFTYNWIQTTTDSLAKVVAKPGAKAETKASYKLMHLMAVQPNIRLVQLHKITAPTLVIGGDHDVIVTQHLLDISKSIPQSYLWIIPNSGHATPISKKEQFNKIVGDFFSEPYRKIEGFDTFN